MKKEPTEKEQVDQSSAKEKTDEPSGFGSFDEAMKAASDELSKKQDSKEEEKVAGEKEEETCDTCTATDEDLKVEDEKDKKADRGVPQKPKYFLMGEDGKPILDNSGEKIPLVFKDGGKEYYPDKPDDVHTWGNMGIHSNRRLEEVKKREEKLAEAEPFIRMIQEAHKNGTLVIKEDGKPQDQKLDEREEEEEEGYVDPELKDLREKVKKLEKGMEKDGEERKKERDMQLKSIFEDQEKKLRDMMKQSKEKGLYGAITRLEDEEYPLDTWDLLAALDDKGNPKYDFETAMKMSHESQVKFVKNFITAHPEIIKDEKDKIIGQHYKEKEEKEAAPIESPDEKATSTSKKPEKKEFTGIEDAMKSANVWLKGRKEAGQKL